MPTITDIKTKYGFYADAVGSAKLDEAKFHMLLTAYGQNKKAIEKGQEAEKNNGQVLNRLNALVKNLPADERRKASTILSQYKDPPKLLGIR